ncbi:DUF11 domain-containing protein [Bacillus cereus]|uniref:DUF11 domain-containing protein n=2 Tax=Bacillus cereus group TaxID=86661 RepID=A0A9W7PZ92_BACCE|nr:DUF11 domain-containing protein [Bacillus cereus]KAB2439664.1 DUF11 domain-containing protein [Bacillus luti]KAA6448396.1 DUF11 domain-containing protein [Bacillus cereus]KAB2420362.1 DUF11 domain-containing protein [Bacillus cereus]KAB2458693.1 DUF11 domain-containing protein [Bacillus cereus]KAB2477927.1 DUF11 domain-containing protein [Bacillus cereus]
MTVNAVPTAGDPSTGIPLGDIPPLGSVTITFQVIIGAAPPSDIINIAGVTADNSEPATSNQVVTTVNHASLVTVKTVSQNFADIGDILTYNVTLVNTGNISADNINFTDPIPNGTTFVPNSVSVNGAPLPGANPALGFNIGSIPPSGFTTVSFQVTVTSIPVPNPTVNIATTTFEFTVVPGQPPVPGNSTSNPVTTQVNNASLTSVKTASQAIASIGDVLTYTVTLTNTGNVPADNTLFTDPIPNGTTLVPNSVTINGVPLPGADPTTGFTLGSIAPGASVIVSFQVTVTSIPVPNPAVNIATTTFDYTVDPNLPPVPGTSPSNPVPVQINSAVLEIIKAVDQSTATLGDILTYTLTITNTGNIPALNVQVTDPIPVETTFINGSVTVNGIPQPSANPNNIIFITSIDPNKSVTIQFRVRITSIPASGLLNNTAIVSYSYVPDPTLPPVFVNNILSNTVTTVVPPAVTINLCPITCHFEKNCSDFFKQQSNFYFNHDKWRN